MRDAPAGSLGCRQSRKRYICAERIRHELKYNITYSLVLIATSRIPIVSNKNAKLKKNSLVSLFLSPGCACYDKRENNNRVFFFFVNNRFGCAIIISRLEGGFFATVREIHRERLR